MFSVALGKFYYKLMNNKLPEYFSFMKPVIPVATERYEIRNPSFHAPNIKKNCRVFLTVLSDKSAKLG